MQKLGNDIADRLESIHALFKDSVKLTLIIRDPAYPDGSRDTIQMNDDWDSAKTAAERLLAKKDNEIYVPGDSNG